jgi:hypothetical protein
MKNLSWKKVALAAVLFGGIAFAVFYATQTKGRAERPAAVNPAFAEYISAYTAGVIGSGSTLRITLQQEVADSAAVGHETSMRLFSFSPAVAGKTIWLDRRTVEFRPDKRLISGQVYEVNFYLSKLFNVAPELKTLTYTFQVIPLSYEIHVDNLKSYVKTELTRQRLEGVLMTSDGAEASAVEQVMKASQEGNILKINWNHSPDGRQHFFVVGDVARKETASEVLLEASGKSLGIDQSQQTTVEVPALGDFKVTNIRVDQGSSQHVVIQFSDPLQEKQNLSGLIHLSGVSSLDTEIRDNEIRVYPPVRQTGTITLTVEAGVRNILDYKLKQSTSFEVQFEEVNPAVRFVGKGTILPDTHGMVLPFEAVNLKSVDVQIIKIYERNVLQFLQTNDYEGNSELRRVGKPVHQRTLSLESAGVSDLGKWNRFTLDLSTFITAEPGAIYQVRLGFKQSYANLSCIAAEETSIAAFDENEDWSEEENENSYWDSYEEYYYGDEYNWEERDNPCHISYYNGSRNVKRNVLASDLGLIAKRGEDGNTVVFVTDLKTTQSLSGVTLELYDFQQQLLSTASTGSDGKAVLSSREKPFVLLARQGAQRGYLKLTDGESLLLSNFDVGGAQVNKGLKGLLYGERGVWRPGDSLFLTFILEDKLNRIPKTHPVVFELHDPQGQATQRQVRSSGEHGFYRFTATTAADAPTGNWMARVKVGGTEFTQPLKIETVKPNRLKINLDFGVEKISTANGTLSGNLNVKWLHGAPGKNLRASFEVLYTPAETRFQRYPDFVFTDPSKSFYAEAQEIFDGYTDESGNATVNVNLEPIDAPGMVNAVFRGKAFEESGNFSIDRFSIPYYPYESFTGVRLPAGDKARGMLLTDTTHMAEVVTLNADGQPVSRDRVEMSLYKLQWRWWWDNSAEEAVYMSDSYATLLSEGVISTRNGKGQWGFKVKYPDWGRYLVKAYDPVSGHSTAKVVYIDWPGWAGRARGGSDGATMLTFTSDKPSYAPGDKATVVIPSGENGRALVSIENGSTVVESYWVDTQKGDTPFTFDVTRAMSPNVYVHVTLVQPHAQTTNDLPMRLYGVIPLQVDDPETHLEPVLTMPDVLEPGKEVVIKVSEKSKRKMTYTLAVVEEGLLDLTRFKTPEPWKHFYAREALGVKTWDLFDQVMGAWGFGIERLLAIGGDAELAAKEDDAKSNRFKPVVKYFGPFTLTGNSNEHSFIMPHYIGSVRTMLVAGYEGAYGQTEKATPVRKPLMVLATLPRVLGPEEFVSMPVTLFSMDKNIRNVKVEVKVNGPVTVREAAKAVTMNGPDATLDFALDAKGMTGNATIEVTATSGSFTSSDIIQLEVRNPNPVVSRMQEAMVEPGKNWTTEVTPAGLPGTNTAMLEVSTLPPINLSQRLRYLMQYPYGCVEQTTSAAFPQLYLDQVKALTPEEQAFIQKNIRAAIDRLKSFQHRDGGFMYWPGMEDIDSWSTSYAGHFLVEAEARGYVVPAEVLKRWKKFQRNRAQDWRKRQAQSSDLIQAYRLYTLALAGDAELGAMNRFREQAGISVSASWMLAAAYAKAGQPEAARKLIDKLPTLVKPYQEMAYTYGSDLRDEAIILETLTLLNERNKGFELVKVLSQALSNPNTWMSTQTVAWCLKSVGVFAKNESRGPLKFTYTMNGKTVTASTGLPVAQVPIPVEASAKTLKVVSESNSVLFARLVTSGQSARGQDEDESANLGLGVTYSDLDGNTLDPTQLEQGQEFVASVTVTHPGIRGSYKNMAIHQVFPSGWEINNLRLEGAENRLSGDRPAYQDIRDDRVYSYFDLEPGQRKTFQVLLTATYAGTYYLPAVSCEAMYDRSIFARKKGQSVSVVKPVIQ